jgi:hypothetical protein
VWLFLYAAFLASAAAAERALDEDAMFADTLQVVDSAVLMGSPAVLGAQADAKTVGLSGSILTLMQTGWLQPRSGDPGAKRSAFGATAVGNAALDVRMTRGFKAFADLEWTYAPASANATGMDTGASWRVPEMFLDANLDHRVYVRVGKQVLQWGRGEFFNPTDLVNVEHKAFFRRIGNREGTYGAKVHVPFGTTWNLYGFLDARGAESPDTLAGAVKAEVLLGRTEMAIMAWGGGYRSPVYGADFSTRILDIHVTGEAALHSSLESRRVFADSGVPRVEAEETKWAPRLALGLGRSFQVSGIQDRLTTLAEFYYNGPGSSARRMGLSSGGVAPSAAAGLAAAFYEPHSVSRRYAAFFGTFNRFLRSDVTLIFNAVGNLDQRCALLSTGVTYRDLNDFSLGLFVQGFAGPGDTEYALAGQSVQVQLIAEAAF